MTPTTPTATPITEATFPKRELEALAEYFEHISNSWLTLGDSESAWSLQRETMENALMLRRAIAAYALAVHAPSVNTVNAPQHEADGLAD